MSTSVSETTVSPSPFSPFSSYSSTSGVTSDDAPDLGAFTTVFRALNTFHPARTHNNDLFSDNEEATPTSSFAFTPSDSDSEVVENSTVWTHAPIASYLSSSPESPPASPSPDGTDTDSANVDVAMRTSGDVETEDDEQDSSNYPSLGLLGALDFLAAERARFVAQLDAAGVRGHSSTTSDGTYQHLIPPRRKRRRKRNRSAHDSSTARHSIDANTATGETEDTVDGVTASHDDADASSSSIDVPSSPAYYKSTPSTPPPHTKERRSKRTAIDEKRPSIHHSKSTPSLRLAVSIPIDARVLQLRNLAHKLRMLFPEDAAALSAVLSDDMSNTLDFVDPRGPVPLPKDTLIHVFIDHSNILFGFLNYLKRHFHRLKGRTKRMDHSALALILERGRPITRRVLVTSSPLYQPVDPAEQLGYEVKILLRVPDTGDGPDRVQHSSGSSGDQAKPNQSHTHSPSRSARQNNRRSFQKGHTRGSSLGNGNISASTESESHAIAGPSTTVTPAKIRYREQGVDELLQLKLHQAIANVDQVPHNATIVLATGDGNVGQFNEEGFLGCVKTALKKGWKVELYSWEGGLSKAWMREFGDNDNFTIHALDRFAMDMLEL
ncbi:hypothetical protein ABKN59_005499 [Abortiporus biennis]